jgi:hypothetical protein
MFNRFTQINKIINISDSKKILIKDAFKDAFKASIYGCGLSIGTVGIVKIIKEYGW